MEKLPVIPLELLEALDERFPERCPDLNWSEREVWARAGERRVIRLLKRAYEKQNENIMR